MFLFNVKEIDAAKSIGVCLQTLKNWRQSGKLPDYIYCSMQLANGGRHNLRYCKELLLRWQLASNEGEQALRSEEIAARELLANQTTVKAKCKK